MLDGLAELEDDDFAVVVQPFFKKVDLPLVNMYIHMQ